MNEFYWIERLDAVNVASAVIGIIALICLLFVSIELYSESYTKEECIEKGIYKARKASFTIIAISLLILIFTPSTKEMYRIAGIGETINYLRKNETAKQLPDKCIKALDLFLDKITKDDKESDKQK
ncbi:hypothetical protein [Bacteroides sp.]|uniref:hypothetical protein n=1 Tax=Bacteroides sp. TaxID=29523 RepID=UPI002A7EBD72|nr:hypothetical protein [Bacteroides sp.]